MTHPLSTFVPLIAVGGCLVSDTQLGPRPDLAATDSVSFVDTRDAPTSDVPRPTDGLAAVDVDIDVDATSARDGAPDTRRDLLLGDSGFPPAPDALPDGLLLGDGPLLGCGPVSFTGCCKDNLLYYCQESGLLRTADCRRQPQCGWSEVYGLYDCGTDGAEDPAGTHPKQCSF